MINLDNYGPEELEGFLNKAKQDGNKFAVELFPQKEPGFRRALNMMVKYAEARLEMLSHAAKGRTEKVAKLTEKLSNIYRTIPEYAQWL
jgi:hypothetical protein